MALSIRNVVEFEQEIKKSRFQGFAAPVQSEQDVKAFLSLKYDATASHQCWAWKIGHDVRFYDAGEPSGTAGRPILACIEGQQLSNILVVVNRWFGGIKLGAGGLLRAYSGCASQTLALAEKIELIQTQVAYFNCHFSEWAQLQYQLQQQQIEYQEEYQDHGVHVMCQLQSIHVEHLAGFLQNLTRGREQLKIIEENHE